MTREKKTHKKVIHETTTTIINNQGKEEKKIEKKVTEETVTVIERPISDSSKPRASQKISIKEKILNRPLHRNAGQEISATDSDHDNSINLEDFEDENEPIVKEKVVNFHAVAQPFQQELNKNFHSNGLHQQKQRFMGIQRSRPYQNPSSLVGGMLNKIEEVVNESDDNDSNEKDKEYTPNKRHKRQKRSSRWIQAIGSNGKIKLKEDRKDLDSSESNKIEEEENFESLRSSESDPKTIEINFREVIKNPLLSQRSSGNVSLTPNIRDKKLYAKTPATMNKSESKKIEPTPVTINVTINPENPLNTGKFKLQKTIGVPVFQSKVDFEAVSSRIRELKNTTEKLKQEARKFSSRSNSKSVTPKRSLKNSEFEGRYNLNSLKISLKSSKAHTPKPGRKRKRDLEINPHFNTYTPVRVSKESKDTISRGSIKRNSGMEEKKTMFSVSSKKYEKKNIQKTEEKSHPYIGTLPQRNMLQQPRVDSQKIKRPSHTKVASMYVKKSEVVSKIKPDETNLYHDKKRFSHKNGQVIASSPKIGYSQKELEKVESEKTEQERVSDIKSGDSMKNSVFSQNRRILKEQEKMFSKIRKMKKKSKSIKIHNRIIEENTFKVREYLISQTK